jgi:hypothetical protein
MRVLWLALVMASSTDVAGQSQPDFSGRWTLVRVAPVDARAAGTLIVKQPIVRFNVHGAPMAPAFLTITIERQFVDRIQTDTHYIGVEGGIVGEISAGQDPRANVPRSRSFVRWEGNRLVMDTGSYAGSSREAGPYTERTETWQISESGQLTTTFTERRQDTEFNYTAIYRR